LKEVLKEVILERLMLSLVRNQPSSSSTVSVRSEVALDVEDEGFAALGFVCLCFDCDHPWSVQEETVRRRAVWLDVDEETRKKAAEK